MGGWGPRIQKEMGRKVVLTLLELATVKGGRATEWDTGSWNPCDLGPTHQAGKQGSPFLEVGRNYWEMKTNSVWGQRSMAPWWAELRYPQGPPQWWGRQGGTRWAAELGEGGLEDESLQPMLTQLKAQETATGGPPYPLGQLL